MLERLGHVMQQLGSADDEKLLADISVMTPADLRQLWG